MRKLFSLLSIFAIVLSCSSDETSTPATPPPAPIVKYTITLSAGEGGTVSTTGGEYEAGQTVSVTATPQGEYVFTSWSDGNTNTTRTITISSNSTLTANFEKRKYPLTINFEGEGEVIEEIVNTGRTTEYDSGTTVKLTAIPTEGWEFLGWTGAIESNQLEVQLNINVSKSVTVTFQMGNELAYLTEIRRVRNEIDEIRRSDEGGASKVYSLDLENDNDLDMILLTNKPYQRDNDRFYIFKNNENKFEKIDSELDLPLSNKCII
ncbi:InlB B-repeat-containing protein [Flavobacteriaceae bacterium]|nr:InlB B-repeat-containing protein [Flavobacteriaceae bacterium]